MIYATAGVKYGHALDTRCTRCLSGLGLERIMTKYTVSIAAAVHAAVGGQLDVIELVVSQHSTQFPADWVESEWPQRLNPFEFRAGSNTP